MTGGPGLVVDVRPGPPVGRDEHHRRTGQDGRSGDARLTGPTTADRPADRRDRRQVRQLGPDRHPERRPGQDPHRGPDQQPTRAMRSGHRQPGADQQGHPGDRAGGRDRVQMGTTDQHRDQGRVQGPGHRHPRSAPSLPGGQPQQQRAGRPERRTHQQLPEPDGHPQRTVTDPRQHLERRGGDRAVHTGGVLPGLLHRVDHRIGGAPVGRTHQVGIATQRGDPPVRGVAELIGRTRRRSQHGDRDQDTRHRQHPAGGRRPTGRHRPQCPPGPHRGQGVPGHQQTHDQPVGRVEGQVVGRQQPARAEGSDRRRGAQVGGPDQQGETRRQQRQAARARGVHRARSQPSRRTLMWSATTPTATRR